MYAKFVAMLCFFFGLMALLHCQGGLETVAKDINRVTNTHVNILDLEEWGFTPEEAQTTLTNMTTTGRLLYKGGLMGWDMVLPISATIMFAGGFFFVLLLPRWKRRRVWWVIAGILIIAYPTLDYWENARNLEMIAKFPNVFYSGTITVLKWIVIKMSGGFIAGHFIYDCYLFAKGWYRRRQEV